MRRTTAELSVQEIQFELDGKGFRGDLKLPQEATGLVVFAHGSGSSRLSPRNRFVAEVLVEAGLATFLVDLLTQAEEHDRSNVFDVELLARRLLELTRQVQTRPETSGLRLGYFGASTGAAAALVAAADGNPPVSAVVSRGGRPDLAGESLTRVTAPTLLLVGGLDPMVLELNQSAFAKLPGEKRLEIIPGASHLFEERGTLEAVAAYAADWFDRFLAAPR
jgi:alpha-beta hydrolase superfamily lysophospholipase